jgi:hypothetical protein
MKTFEVAKMKFTSPDGKVIASDDVQRGKFEWVGVGYAPESDVAYVFDTRDRFVKWSKGTKFEAKVAYLFNGLDEAKKAEHSDNTVAMARQKALITRVSSELEELSKRTGLALGSEQLLLRASHRPEGVEGPIFGSAVLYNSPAAFGAGGWLPMVSSWWMPDFRWFGFDNITSSGWVFGDVVLCTGYWYSGMGISFRSGAFPPFSYDSITFSLKGSGWDNTISSGVSLWW